MKWLEKLKENIEIQKSKVVLLCIMCFILGMMTVLIQNVFN